MPGKHLTRSQRRNLWNIAFVAPQFILYVGLTILPFFIALPIIFTDRVSVMDTDYSWIGFRNFATIFQGAIGEEFKPALLRTVSFTFFNYLTVYLFGLTLALFMFEFKTRFQRVKGAIFTIIPDPQLKLFLEAPCLPGIQGLHLRLLKYDTFYPQH